MWGDMGRCGEIWGEPLPLFLACVLTPVSATRPDIWRTLVRVRVRVRDRVRVKVRVRVRVRVGARARVRVC